MKKRLVEKILRKSGWWLLRQGGSHEVWTNGEEKVSIPRHKEVDELTARGVMKKVWLNAAKK